MVVCRTGSWSNHFKWTLFLMLDGDGKSGVSLPVISAWGRIHLYWKLNWMLMRWLKITKHRWCFQIKRLLSQLFCMYYWPIFSSDLLCLKCKGEKEEQEESLESFHCHLLCDGLAYWSFPFTCYSGLVAGSLLLPLTLFSLSFSDWRIFPGVVLYFEFHLWCDILERKTTIWVSITDIMVAYVRTWP